MLISIYEKPIKIMKNYQLNQHLECRIEVLEQALSQLGQGILLLSKFGDVLFATNVAQKMIDQNDGLAVCEGKLVADLPQDSERLKSMLAGVAAESVQDKNYKNFYIHRKDSVRPYLLFISKMGMASKEDSISEVNASQDKSSEDNILIVIKDIQANTSHWLDRLKAKYGLTNREADFAVLLTEGRSIKEIGMVMDIAEDTARQYLKNCFKKMEVQKQHELVCLALDYSRKR